MSVVIVGLLVGAGALIRTYSTTVSDTGQATVVAPPGVALSAGEPVTVAVAAAGTIADAPASSKRSRVDSCPDLRGTQPKGFDCSLPLFVSAIDLSAVRVKAPYECADPENYRLVRGQLVQNDKKCVLKTAKAGQP